MGTRVWFGRYGTELENVASDAIRYMPTRHRLAILLTALDEGASVAEARRRAGLRKSMDAYEDLAEVLFGAEGEILECYEYLSRPGTIALDSVTPVVEQIAQALDSLVEWEGNDRP